MNTKDNLAAFGLLSVIGFIIYLELFATGTVVAEIEANITSPARYRLTGSFPAVAQLASGETIGVECDDIKAGESVILQHHKTKIFRRDSFRCKNENSGKNS